MPEWEFSAPRRGPCLSGAGCPTESQHAATESAPQGESLDRLRVPGLQGSSGGGALQLGRQVERAQPLAWDKVRVDLQGEGRRVVPQDAGELDDVGPGRDVEAGERMSVNPDLYNGLLERSRAYAQLSSWT